MTAGALASHPHARPTVHGRRLLVDRLRAGHPVVHVAHEMGISRATAHKWVRHWRAEGDAGLCDRTSQPRATPHRMPADVEERICAQRREQISLTSKWSLQHTPPPHGLGRSAIPLHLPGTRKGTHHVRTCSFDNRRNQRHRQSDR